jgi:hypothetical protein
MCFGKLPKSHGQYIDLFHGLNISYILNLVKRRLVMEKLTILLQKQWMLNIKMIWMPQNEVYMLV